MATKLKILPPQGSPLQTDVEQLILLRNKLPVAIHTDKNGDYLMVPYWL
jgi:hypothetical protein